MAGIQSCEKGSFADRIQEQVIRARQNAEWRRQYMDWKMTLLSERSKGREEGRKEGREIGTLLKEVELVSKKIKRGLKLPAIAVEMEMEEAAIRPIYDAVKASAPDYDSEQILQMLLKEDGSYKM